MSITNEHKTSPLSFPPWVANSLLSNGSLTSRQITFKAFEATMSWQGLKPIRGVGETFYKAMWDLDNQLMEHAADEMMKSGIV